MDDSYYRDILELVGNGEISEIDITDDEENEFQNSRDLLEQLEEANTFDYYKDINNDSSGNNTSIPDDCLPVVTPQKDIKWVQQPFKAPDIALDDLEVAESITCLHNPTYYFMQYFDNDIFETIAINTNLYTTQKNVSDFVPTNKEEIQILIAMHLIMGCIKSPISLYWHEILKNQMFCNMMTKDRFLQLRQNLHIINNLDIPINNQDKFVKVRPLYNQIKKKCNNLLKKRNLSIDEHMLPIKKIWSSKVLYRYEKGISWPWGIKIFVLTSECGMIYDFILYQGDSTELNQNNLKIFGLGPSIVLHLVQTVKKNAHFLFFGHFFSNYILLEHLYNLGIYAAGIIKPNKFANPLLLTDKQMSKMGPGTIFEMSSDIKNACSIGIVKCYDNQCTVLGSNFITMGQIDKIEIYDKNLKKDILVDRPEIVKLCNESMGGAEKSEEYINSCKNFINTKKWTLQLIIHAFDMAACNAWLQYKNEAIQLSVPKEKKISLFHFRLKLAQEMIAQAKEHIQV